MAAPLTGDEEHHEPDFEAVTPLGFPVIAEYAHIRRARSGDPTERIFRRAYNYESETEGDAGLLFACYQADPEHQFVPIQRRLDELDLLNEWITHVGSAVFAIPRGVPTEGSSGKHCSTAEPNWTGHRRRVPHHSLRLSPIPEGIPMALHHGKDRSR